LNHRFASATDTDRTSVPCGVSVTDWRFSLVVRDRPVVKFPPRAVASMVLPLARPETLPDALCEASFQEPEIAPSRFTTSLGSGHGGEWPGRRLRGVLRCSKRQQKQQPGGREFDVSNHVGLLLKVPFTNAGPGGQF
jgi:hypothetical protein